MTRLVSMKLVQVFGGKTWERFEQELSFAKCHLNRPEAGRV